MTIDYQATLLDPNYEMFGVEATIAPDSTGPFTVTVIDKTAGLSINLSGGPEVETIGPAATVRMADLLALGLTRADLDEETIAFNGQTWRIRATRPKPSPNGEADGELVLLLTEA